MDYRRRSQAYDGVLRARRYPDVSGNFPDLHSLSSHAPNQAIREGRQHEDEAYELDRVHGQAPPRPVRSPARMKSSHPRHRATAGPPDGYGTEQHSPAMPSRSPQVLQMGEQPKTRKAYKDGRLTAYPTSCFIGQAFGNKNTAPLDDEGICELIFDVDPSPFLEDACPPQTPAQVDGLVIGRFVGNLNSGRISGNVEVGSDPETDIPCLLPKPPKPPPVPFRQMGENKPWVKHLREDTPRARGTEGSGRSTQRSQSDLFQADTNKVACLITTIDLATTLSLEWAAQSLRLSEYHRDSKAPVLSSLNVTNERPDGDQGSSRRRPKAYSRHERDNRFSGTSRLSNSHLCVSLCNLADANDANRARRIELECISIHALKELNKLVKKLAEKSDAFLASGILIRQIPRLLGPGLSKGPRPRLSRKRPQQQGRRGLFDHQCQLREVPYLGVAVSHADMVDEQVLANVMLSVNLLASLRSRTSNLSTPNPPWTTPAPSSTKPFTLFWYLTLGLGRRL
ncbi:hypothetical protein BKA70DRAFT_1459838 [Coprinopsis sp. MPI-PUGE-AT-0042]|nr:hypothetical protein BKA70DRAFT_1459838 [Coprinopsis sp. MPI-PUGE-AT-0042]